MNESVDLITEAASQDDRWLFVALLVIVLVSIAWLVRYFTQKIDKAEEEARTMATSFNKHLLESHQQMVTVVQSNTDMMRKIEKRLGG